MNGLFVHWSRGWEVLLFSECLVIPPASTKLKGGILVSRRPYVSPSVCGQNCVRSVTSTILTESISHLINHFRRRVTCNIFCKVPKLDFWQIFQMSNFDFVLFCLGIWYEAIVWVIMGRRGYSQNAGVLVVLVIDDMCCWYCLHSQNKWIYKKHGRKTEKERMGDFNG